MPGDIDPDPVIVAEHVYVPVEARRKRREQEELEKAIADALTSLAILGIEKAKPHRAKFWREKVKPIADCRLPIADDVRTRITTRKHRGTSVDIS